MMSIKQIRCFQWIKDTNLKANHNGTAEYIRFDPMFPMDQRY